MKNDYRQYDLIVLNNSPDAVVWRIVSIKNFMLEIIDVIDAKSNPNLATQMIDISLVKRPNKAQLNKFNETNK